MEECGLPYGGSIFAEGLGSAFLDIPPFDEYDEEIVGDKDEEGFVNPNGGQDARVEEGIPSVIW